MRYCGTKYVSLVSDEQRSKDRWGWFCLTLVFAAVALVAVACGSSSSDQSSADSGEAQEEETTSPEPSPVEVVQVAYKKMASAKTAKIDLNATMSGLPNGMSFDMSGQGAVDFENQNAVMAMQMPMGMGDVEMRMLDATIYQRWPDAMRAQMPEQKPWIKMDLDEMMQEQYGKSFSQMQGSAQANPSQQLAYLQGVSDSVEEVGDEEVRGEPTTHYSATVDLEKAAEQQDLTEEARQAQEQMTQQLGISELPVDVWIDGDGLVRRYEMSLPLPVTQNAQGAGQQGGDGQGQMTMTEEFYDFGTPVDVEAPTPDQVTDFAELMAAAQQQKAPAQQQAPAAQ